MSHLPLLVHYNGRSIWAGIRANQGEEIFLTGNNIVQGARPMNHVQFADGTLNLGATSLTISKRFKVIYGWNTPTHILGRIFQTL
jgi:hypothetical protein